MSREDDFKLSPKDAERERQDALAIAAEEFAKNWFIADEIFDDKPFMARVEPFNNPEMHLVCQKCFKPFAGSYLFSDCCKAFGIYARKAA